jgi:hypothetical protein
VLIYSEEAISFSWPKNSTDVEFEIEYEYLTYLPHCILRKLFSASKDVYNLSDVKFTKKKKHFTGMLEFKASGGVFLLLLLACIS